MLNKQGFNLWAEDYDQSVQLSEEKNEYPFAGYKSILNINALRIPLPNLFDLVGVSSVF